MSLNLSNKNITDDDNIFEEITSPQSYSSLNLSDNKLTSLPKDLSKFTNLSILNLMNNNFNNYNEVALSLETLPELKELYINISNQENAIAILSNLPNLIILNGQNTNESSTISNNRNLTIRKNSTFDLDNRKDFSLNDEIELYKFILNKINNKNFTNGFQEKLKTEISLLNANINCSNFKYNVCIIKAKNNICNYIFDYLIQNLMNQNLEKNLALDIIHIIRNKIKDNENLLFEYILKNETYNNNNNEFFDISNSNI